LPTNVRIIGERLSGARSYTRGSEELGRVVRQWIERNRASHRLPDKGVGVFGHCPAAGAAGRRGQELVSAGIRDGHKVGDDLFLAQSFVVPKEKRLVPLDRTAKTTAELVLPERRRLRCRVPGLNDRVEEVARFELVVAQKFVYRPVKSVRAGAARGVDDGAAAAELGRVRVRQRLK